VQQSLHLRQNGFRPYCCEFCMVVLPQHDTQRTPSVALVPDSLTTDTGESAGGVSGGAASVWKRTSCSTTESAAIAFRAAFRGGMIAGRKTKRAVNHGATSQFEKEMATEALLYNPAHKYYSFLDFKPCGSQQTMHISPSVLLAQTTCSRSNIVAI
jgi:hypothetical protein